MANKEKGSAGPSEESAAMVIRAQYIKDLSFESPNSIKSFTENTDAQPNINVNVQVRALSLGNNNFEVILDLNAEAKRNNDVMFVAELSYGSVVSIGSIPEDQIGHLVMVECPHLMFPFARNILADVTRDGGFPPLLLSPVDFSALYAHQEQQAQTNGAAPSA